MRKIEAIFSNSPGNVDVNIKNWLHKNPDINIISVNGAIRGEDGDTITYILYEPKPEGVLLS